MGFGCLFALEGFGEAKKLSVLIPLEFFSGEYWVFGRQE